MSSEESPKLQQSLGLGVFHEYQILNGQEVRVSLKQGSRQKSYLVSLLALADKSRYRLNVAWGWLLACLFSAGLLILYYAFKDRLDWKLGQFEYLLVAGLSLIALASLVIFVLKLKRKRIYYARHSRVPLFGIVIGNPDSRSYRTFTEILSEQLKRARGFWKLTTEQQFAGEIKMLRRLANEGIISKLEYEKAKNRLFRLTNRR